MRESSRRTDGSPSRALDLALGALREQPAGLLTDLDGTLSPIVSDPAAARLVPGVPEALAVLAERLAVVAAITGRGVLDARRMLEGAPVLVAGNHGTEWLRPEAGEAEPSPGAARVREALEEALARIPALEGVILEDKGLSASLHVRGAPDPAAALDRLRAALGTPAGIDIREGRMVLELRPPALGDKGTAARAIIDRHRLRGVVVLGDDVTDFDMLAGVGRLRADGEIHAALIGVEAGDETPPGLAEVVDVSLESPSAAALLLNELARTLSRQPPPGR